MMRGQTIPHVRPSGIVTVAFLKARLDEGLDHLGIFMPLVTDAIRRIQAQSFTTRDVQDALTEHHGLAMPQPAVETLLRRATRKGHLKREMGRFQIRSADSIPRLDVDMEKQHIRAGQERLASALQAHGASRQHEIPTTDEALDMLLRFMEQEQIGLLLGGSPSALDRAAANHKTRGLIAEFIHDVAQTDPALTTALQSILEGVVLYHAAFLPDLGTDNRSFKGLQVAFDSGLVRQALGYEGPTMRALLRETIEVLKAGGASCIVFDKTLHEIRRILAMYEHKLGSYGGRQSLRPVPMARHFLTQCYTPSDVREMNALLEHEVKDVGFHIQKTPRRNPLYVGEEQALALRLADPHTQDDSEPRVQHDVDCVAAILTLRRNHQSARVEDSRAVFVTSSPLVIRNTRLWYFEDQRGAGVEPVVHLRALANLAWLKKPALCKDFKRRELVALCAAALRPRQETWERFLRHLDSLVDSGRLSSDDVASLLVSSMSDQLLREAEEDDPSDIDATTLDEIVDRVKQSYAVEAKSRIEAVKQDYESRLEASVSRERTLAQEAGDALAAKEREYESHLRKLKAEATTEAERRRRGELRVEALARKISRATTGLVYCLLVCVLAVGGVALVASHPFHHDWIGIVLGIGIVGFVTLEAFGILRHLRELRSAADTRLTRQIRKRLSGESE